MTVREEGASWRHNDTNAAAWEALPRRDDGRAIDLPIFEIAIFTNCGNAESPKVRAKSVKNR
jgi:hypothetical protein